MHGFFEVVTRRAFEELLASFPKVEPESVELARCSGRILARDVVSGEYLPLADRSCMDGYAVRARDLFGASESNPAYLECDGRLTIDQVGDTMLAPGRCLGIPTGGLLPEGADAVVMVEHTHDMGGGTIEIRTSVAPGENVMEKGEDARPGSVVLETGQKLRPQDVGIMAALGVDRVIVGKRPGVGIVSTGDELVPVTQTPRPGQVRDVNTFALAAMVERAGGTASPRGIVPDDLERLTAEVRQALAENDLLLMSGGSSVGARDLTIETITSLPGAEVLAHGVVLKPGKPTILARVPIDGVDKAVIGLPGQVTSAQVVMMVLVEPFLRHLAGQADPFAQAGTVRRAVLSVNSPSPKGREDYLRVRLIPREGEPDLAEPVLGKSGLLRTLLQAHGLVRIPAESEGVYAGEEVDVRLV